MHESLFILMEAEFNGQNLSVETLLRKNLLDCYRCPLIGNSRVKRRIQLTSSDEVSLLDSLLNDDLLVVVGCGELVTGGNDGVEELVAGGNDGVEELVVEVEFKLVVRDLRAFKAGASPLRRGSSLARTFLWYWSIASNCALVKRLVSIKERSYGTRVIVSKRRNCVVSYKLLFARTVSISFSIRIPKSPSL